MNTSSKTVHNTTTPAPVQNNDVKDKSAAELAKESIATAKQAGQTLVDDAKVGINQAAKDSLEAEQRAKETLKDAGSNIQARALGAKDQVNQNLEATKQNTNQKTNEASSAIGNQLENVKETAKAVTQDIKTGLANANAGATSALQPTSTDGKTNIPAKANVGDETRHDNNTLLGISSTSSDDDKNRHHQNGGVNEASGGVVGQAKSIAGQVYETALGVGKQALDTGAKIRHQVYVAGVNIVSTVADTVSHPTANKTDTKATDANAIDSNSGSDSQQQKSPSIKDKLASKVAQITPEPTLRSPDDPTKVMARNENDKNMPASSSNPETSKSSDVVIVEDTRILK